jgi:hypothetical protein
VGGPHPDEERVCIRRGDDHAPGPQCRMLVPLQCNLEPVILLICIHAVPLLDPPQINHIQSQNIYYNGYVDCKERGCIGLTGAGLTPVHFFSHGSTMMLGEESTSGDYWKKCGDEALAHDIKGVIMMVSFVSVQIIFRILTKLRVHIGMPEAIRSWSQPTPNPARVQ